MKSTPSYSRIPPGAYCRSLRKKKSEVVNNGAKRQQAGSNSFFFLCKKLCPLKTLVFMNKVHSCVSHAKKYIKPFINVIIHTLKSKHKTKITEFVVDCHFQQITSCFNNPPPPMTPIRLRFSARQQWETKETYAYLDHPSTFMYVDHTDTDSHATLWHLVYLHCRYWSALLWGAALPGW